MGREDWGMKDGMGHDGPHQKEMISGAKLQRASIRLAEPPGEA
jgi:hypothetical protein